jgi:hypothetical protein
MHLGVYVKSRDYAVLNEEVIHWEIRIRVVQEWVLKGVDDHGSGPLDINFALVQKKDGSVIPILSNSEDATPLLKPPRLEEMLKFCFIDSGPDDSTVLVGLITSSVDYPKLSDWWNQWFSETFNTGRKSVVEKPVDESFLSRLDRVV